jgi:hypothetical protein
MSPRPAAELPGIALPAEPDPELVALPAPRRPGRKVTLVTMAITAVVTLAMAFALRGEVRYALESGPPNEIGNLTELTPRADLANTWVHGDALLSSQHAIRYKRQFDRATGFRLAPVAGNEKIWVQVSVPEGMEGPRFVPPTSFVGRLVPMSDAGLRHSGLGDAVEYAKAGNVPADAWLLIDGESPVNTRWALGLFALFLGFAAFNLWGLFRLLRPLKEEASDAPAPG